MAKILINNQKQSKSGGKMLIAKRYDEILKILDEEKYISANELSKRLYVSLPTVRRDLAALHKQGLVIRSHGGAKKVQAESVVAPLNFRKTVNSIKKRQLCKEASGIIKDGDIIFIDSSTTTLQMAEFIDKKSNVTVITNGITLAMMLSQKGIKTYCTGGEIFENSLAYYGSFAEEFIQKFNIDTVFLSCHGINKNGVLNDPSLPETQIRKTAIKQSKKMVFLCDESKFNLSAPYNLTNIQNMDYIITNTEKIYNYFKKKDFKKIIIVK